jgi:hypothetical protein
VTKHLKVLEDAGAISRMHAQGWQGVLANLVARVFS